MVKYLPALPPHGEVVRSQFCTDVFIQTLAEGLKVGSGSAYQGNALRLEYACVKCHSCTNTCKRAHYYTSITLPQIPANKWTMSHFAFENVYVGSSVSKQQFIYCDTLHTTVDQDGFH